MISDRTQSSPSIQDFVFQDAIERAFEIKIKGIKEYEIEKRKLYQQKKEVVQGEYDRKGKDKLVERRIHRSSLINRSRMEKMEARNKYVMILRSAIMKIVSVAQHRILKQVVSNQGTYKELLRKLIVEGLIKLFEEKVFIKCLKRDEALIESILPQCKRDYEALMKKEVQHEIIVNLTISKQYLVERPLGNTDEIRVEDYTLERSKEEIIRKSDEDIKCFGGVILTNESGLIICKNTLDTRIDLAFSLVLPQIRSSLFPGHQ